MKPLAPIRNPHRLPAGRFSAVLLGLAFGAAGAAELETLSRIGATAGDEFGYASLSDGSQLLVSAPGEAADAGAVYLFDCSSAPCLQQLRLAAPAAVANAEFGAALAWTTSTLAIGAPGQGAGVVYVYTSPVAGTWNLQATLSASGGQIGDRFGTAVALAGDTLLVGADGDDQGRGTAYAFNRSGSVWALPTQLLAGDGAAGDGFGAAVALDAGHALIGAPQEGESGPGAVFARGAAYLFERITPTAWAQPVKLLANTPMAGDAFGFSVALDSGLALVGAPFANLQAGSISVFEDIGVGWAATAELGSAFTPAGARLGWSLSLASNELLGGAPFAAATPGANCGTVARFSRNPPLWTELDPLLIALPQPGDLAGWSVSARTPRYALGRPGFLSSGQQHQGVLAWFDFAEQVFSDDYETADPLCR